MKQTNKRVTDRHNRMPRVLVCLVISMTAGAICLDWMRPGRSSGSSLSDVPLIARTPWQGIRIERYQPQSGTRPEDSHFVIDRDGRWVETPSWRSQRALGAAQIVRIGLLSERDSDAMTSAQESTASQLAELLQEKYGISSQQVVWVPPPTRSHPRPS